MKVFFSNRIEQLADSVKSLVLEEKNPFACFEIVVPSSALKNWLTYRFASDQQLHLFSGIQICLWGEYLKRLFPKIPSHLELSLRLEQEVRKGVRGLEDYLEGRSDKEVGAFCDELSALFLDYGTFGQSSLAEWENKEGWQQILWNRSWKDSFPWDVARQDTSVALFGFSFLPPLYFRSVKATHAFVLSPSSLYWEDFLSEKKQAFLRVKKEGSAKSAWQEYFDAQNPLLANLGMLGQRFLKQLGLPDEEIYEESQTKSLLSQLQNQMLFLEKEELSLDETIQVHAAPSRWREVEVVANLIQKFNLQDVAVYAPDITLYAPYIHVIFTRLGLDYAIYDLPFSTKSSLIRVLQLLLQLSQREFQARDFLELLSFGRFTKKWGWKEEEVEKVALWIKEANIIFGMEGWQHGFWRLLEALVLEKTPSGLAIGFSEAELLGQFMEVFSHLMKAVSFEGTKTINEWGQNFESVLFSFFALEREDESFLRELSNMKKIETEPLPFSSFERALKSLFLKGLEAFQPHLLHAVQFHSLSADVSIPKEAVILMGLEEGSFPRPFSEKNLQEIQLEERPLLSEEDRMLFLELFLNARSYFFLSYTHLDEEDRKEKAPSVLIQEFLRWAPLSVTYHPAHPFDKSYFQGDNLWGSPKDFFLAQALYNKEKKPPSPLLSLVPELSLSEPNTGQLEIWQMQKVMRAPLQFYFEKKHRLFFEKESVKGKEFSLSALDLSFFRKSALLSDLDSVILEAKKEGRLPVGVWESAAICRIRLDVETYLENLKALTICPEEIFSVHLVQGCPALEQVEPQVWVAPPLHVGGVQIIGHLENVTLKGILVHGKGDEESLLKVWPLYLLSQLLPLNIPSQILCTKDGKICSMPLKSPEASMEKFLHYFRLCEENPSPFFPQVRTSFFKEGVDAFEKKIKALDEESYPDPAFLWIKRQERLPSLTQWYHLWKEPIREAFDVFV